MRKISVSVIALSGLIGLGLPAFAQTTDAPAEAPATTMDAPAPSVVIVAPEGFTVTDFATVTADQLKGLNIYDAEGKDVAEIADVVIGADNKVTGIVTDVGGFLGMGEHRISLSPDQVHIYKNADNELRAFVTMTKDELKALPEYVAPQ